MTATSPIAAVLKGCTSIPETILVRASAALESLPLDQQEALVQELEKSNERISAVEEEETALVNSMEAAIAKLEKQFSHIERQEDESQQHLQDVHLAEEHLSQEL